MKKILILILLTLSTFTNKSYGMGVEEIIEMERIIEADIDNSLEKKALMKTVFYYIKIKSKTNLEKIFRKYENLREKSFIETCLKMAQEFQREDVIDYFYQPILDFLYSELTRPDCVSESNRPDSVSEITRTNIVVRENRSGIVNRYARAKISIANFSLRPIEEL